MPDVAHQSVWSSLEVAKLLASLLTPLVVVIMGSLLQRQLARQDRAWKAQTRLADRRLAVYDSLRADLNRIYCFVEDVGTWKEESPDTIIKAKRQVDQAMFSNEAIWAPKTLVAYRAYMDSAFDLYQAVGTDAKIKTTDHEKRYGIPGWNADWSARLSFPSSSHKQAYKALNDALSRDLMLEIPSDG